MADFNSSLPVKTQANGDIVAKIGDGTTPSQQLAVDSSGRITIKVQDGSGNAITSTSSAIDVNIKSGGATPTADKAAFTYGTTTDTVAGGVFQDTAPTLIAGTSGAIRLNAQRGLHANLRDSSGNELLGSKTSANSLSVVIASDNAAVAVKNQDGSGNAITSQSNGSQRALDVGVNVAGVQVDPRSIRALTSTDVVTANIKDATGTAFSISNPLPVYIQETLGTAVNDYLTNAAVAAAGTSNHDYTVTAAKTLTLTEIKATASGKLKIEVQIETGVASGVFNSKFVGFNSTAVPNISISLSAPIQVAAGVRVRTIRTNNDAASQDLYSTVCGREN